MQQDHTTSNDVLNEVRSILSEHYGIKVASLTQLLLTKGATLEEVATAYHGQSKTKQARKSSVESMRNLLKKYGGAQ